MKYTYITLGIYFTQIVLTSKLYLVIMYKAKYQLDIGSYAYYLKKIHIHYRIISQSQFCCAFWFPYCLNSFLL